MPAREKEMQFSEIKKMDAPPGNRTRGARMGILHVTTTLAVHYLILYLH